MTMMMESGLRLEGVFLQDFVVAEVGRVLLEEPGAHDLVIMTLHTGLQKADCWFQSSPSGHFQFVKIFHGVTGLSAVYHWVRW